MIARNIPEMFDSPFDQRYEMRKKQQVMNVSIWSYHFMHTQALIA